MSDFKKANRFHTIWSACTVAFRYLFIKNSKKKIIGKRIKNLEQTLRGSESKFLPTTHLTYFHD